MSYHRSVERDQSSGPFRRERQRSSLRSLVVVGLAWALSASHVVHGGEFHFMVKDLPDNSAAWVPGEVVIHTETDIRGGLVFVLANPTARTHVFLVEELYEQVVGENGEVAAKPLRVTVAPEDTVRAVLNTAPLEKDWERGRVEEFRFFCPLHRADTDPGGTLRMIHTGGTIKAVQ